MIMRRIFIAISWGWVLMGLLGCDSFFYYPNQKVYDAPKQYGLAHESVHFESGDGTKLHGWFFPAEGPGRAKGTVLHLHGNAGNITGHFHHVAWLPARGYHVLCFDYRGYGKSEGRITRAGSMMDACAALDYLLQREDVDNERIVAFGQSLGGAIGIVLTAQRREILGIATDGAFDSYQRIAAWHIRRNPLMFVLAWWVPLMMSKDHQPIDHIARIAPRPVLLMHGTDDEVVDPAMATRLYEAAGEPKELWLAEDMDHYGAMQEMSEVAHAKLLAFFGTCFTVHESRE